MALGFQRLNVTNQMRKAIGFDPIVAGDPPTGPNPAGNPLSIIAPARRTNSSGGLLPINNPSGLLDTGRQLDFGAALLEGSGPSLVPRTFVQNVGRGLQSAEAGQMARLQQQALHQEMADFERRRAELGQLVGHMHQMVLKGGGTASQANAVAAATMVDPNAGMRMAQSIIERPEETREASSPLGKLYDDFEAALAVGNVERAEGLQTIIEGELAKARGDNEDPLGFSDIRNVRNDLIQNSASFLEQQRGFQNVLVAVNDPSPAGDLAIVFNTMKILDPGSIVRGSEVELTENAGSLAQRVAADFSRVFSGERLTDDQRQDFLKMARDQFSTARRDQERLIQDARGFAERNSLSVADVVPEFLIPLSLESGTSQPVNLGNGVTLEFLD